MSAVQVKDECRRLIKTTICIEHRNVKGVLNDGFWNYGREEGRCVAWSCRMNVTRLVYRVIIMNNQLNFQCLYMYVYQATGTMT
jgi:hypothetical protein